MGLPRAMQAHKLKNLEEAAFHYQRALDQGDKTPHIYQNYGSILYNKGETEKATKIYEAGLTLYPTHLGILLNYANSLRKVKPSLALELYGKSLRLSLASKCHNHFEIQGIVADILSIFDRLNLPHLWHAGVAQFMSLNRSDFSSGVLKHIMLLSNKLQDSKNAPLLDFDLWIDCLNEALQDCPSLINQHCFFYWLLTIRINNSMRALENILKARLITFGIIHHLLWKISRKQKSLLASTHGISVVIF